MIGFCGQECSIRTLPHTSPHLEAVTVPWRGPSKVPADVVVKLYIKRPFRTNSLFISDWEKFIIGNDVDEFAPAVFALGREF